MAWQGNGEAFCSLEIGDNRSVASCGNASVSLEFSFGNQPF